MRQISNIYDDSLFVPYDRFGTVIKKLFWYNISFDIETGMGTYVMKFEKGARTLQHIHGGYEEFLVLDGILIDNDGYRYNKGDFVTILPGSSHYSYTDIGCKVLVFMRGINRVICDK